MHHSFRLKLCIWIFGISILTFSLIFGMCAYFVHKEVKSEVNALVNAKLDIALNTLESNLAGTEVAANNLAGIFQSKMDQHQPDSIRSVFKYFLRDNPHVQGVSIAFEPGVINHNPKGYAPYTMRTDTGIVERDMALFSDYRNKDWYKTAKHTGKPYWSDSFIELNDTMITSYTIPIHRGGRFIGVISVDLGLNGLPDKIQKLRPYPNAMLTVMDRQGRFIVHPIRSYILKESQESLIKKAKYTPNLEIIKRINAHERGMDSYTSDKGVMYMYYAPEHKTGFTVTLEVPRREVALGYDHMFTVLFIAMGIGILLLLVVSWIIITQMKNETESRSALENELHIARNIQMSMVPKEFPPYPDRHDLDIYASLTPAKAVGGDLYDFYLDGDDFYFCIGDVSGKGVPASLFMAITRSLFRNAVMHQSTPGKIASGLNNAISQGNDEGMFVTMIIGKLSLDTGLLTICNCGHNVPVTNGVLNQETLHVSPSAEPHYIPQLPTNIPVGVIEDFDYEEVTITLEENVALFLYTDGVTEAENKEKVLYGDDRLLECIKRSGNGTSQAIVQAVVDDVHTHAQGADQSDDITLLCIRYNKA